MKDINELGIEELNKELEKFIKKFNILIINSPEILLDTVKKIYLTINFLDRVFPLKTLFNFTHYLQKTENQNKKLIRNYLATEDVFIIAVAFLDLELSKIYGVYHTKGELNNQEYKIDRDILFIDNELILKSLASDIALPDFHRSKSEQVKIKSTFDYLIKLNNLYPKVFELVEFYKSNENEDLRFLKYESIKKFKLTQSQYKWLIEIANKFELLKINPIERIKREQRDDYKLTTENNLLIKNLAKKLKVTPTTALNSLITDFFEIVERESQMNKNLNNFKFEKHFRSFNKC